MRRSKYASELLEESGLENSVTNLPRVREPALADSFPFLRPYSQQDLNSILVLPPEILKLVFSFFKERLELVSLLTVCKYWARLLVELIWFRPKLQSEAAYRGIQKVLDADPASTFFNYRLYVRRLNVCFILNFAEDSFLEKFQNCPNLERLTLVNCSKLTGSAIAKVLRNCTKLQSVDMSGIKCVTDEILDALATNCPRLQGIYAPDAGAVSNAAIIRLFRACPYLKRIKLTKSENVDDAAIDELSRNFKYVVEIDLHGCPNVTDDSLSRVFSNLEQLREFRISQNKNVSDRIFQSLPDVSFLTRLRILDFTDCLYITDRSIEKVVRCAPRLRNVVLSKCINVTDASLRALATLNKSLHYVHLGHCSNITDYGVKLLVASCYRLQYIDLACCTQLTDASVVELAALPRLKRIGLVKCVHITDRGITQLVHKRGPGDLLERVHLSYCTQLTQQPIFLLLRHCPKLTHLLLTGIQAFLRPEFRQFCRAAPEEFTPHQRLLFCVFSGAGVRQLREFLTGMYPVEAQYGNDMLRQPPAGFVAVDGHRRVWNPEGQPTGDTQRFWDALNDGQRNPGVFQWNNAYLQTATPIPESLLFPSADNAVPDAMPGLIRQQQQRQQQREGQRHFIEGDGDIEMEGDVETIGG